MKKSFLSLFSFTILMNISAQTVNLTDEMALKLSQMPLHCIGQEYPNKTAHIINNENEATLSPKELHPSFYGCFDWHSSVHGHWMLVRLLKTKPKISNAKEIEQILHVKNISKNHF